MEDYGLVSIITPCYNGARFLGETIESVQRQTYQNWEMLIQDDGSFDDSVDVALKYAVNDPRIKVQKNDRNSRPAVTRNNAILRSEGQWVAFLDSDDLWMPTKLEVQLKWMAEHNANFSFMQYEHFGENGEFIGDRAKVVENLSYRKLLLHCWPGCLTVMYRQDPENKITIVDIKNNEDHALFLRAVAELGPGRGIPQCLSLYRIRKGSFSRNKFKLIEPYIETLHRLEHKNIVFSTFCVFTHVFVKTFFKYKKVDYENSLFKQYKEIIRGGGNSLNCSHLWFLSYRRAA